MRGAVFLLAVVVAPACSGDDDPAAAGTEPVAATERAHTEARSTTVAITGTSRTSPDGFCPTVQHYIETVEVSPVFTSASPPERDVLAAALDDLETQLDQLEATAPADVAVDVGLVADGTRDFIAAIAAHDYDFTALAEDPAFAELTTEFEQAAYLDATEHLRTYAQETCGITTISAPSGT